MEKMKLFRSPNHYIAIVLKMVHCSEAFDTVQNSDICWPNPWYCICVDGLNLRPWWQLLLFCSTKLVLFEPTPLNRVYSLLLRQVDKSIPYLKLARHLSDEASIDVVTWFLVWWSEASKDLASIVRLWKVYSGSSGLPRALTSFNQANSG